MMNFPRGLFPRSVIHAVLLLIILLMEPATLPAQQSEDIETRLATLSQPWKERVHRITLKEYNATLDYWQQQHPKILKVERIGVSSSGMKIHLLKITDPDVPEAQKQVALISSLHGGPERSGTNTVLHLTEWLLGDSDQAKQTRRHQIVLLVPIINPEAFFITDRFLNVNKIDPYTGGGIANWDLKTMSYRKLDEAPEVKAILQVIDRYQPEIHADMHGTGLQEFSKEQLGDRTQYQGNTMFEVSGSAYSNYALRPWDWRVTEAVIAAGVEAGYGSDRFEADAQRGYWGPGMNPMAKKLWVGRPNFYTAQYGYMKYHTMISAFEVGWEESGLARIKGLLNIGNQRWQNEPYTGYPVNRVASYIGHYVLASGVNTERRRASRVELWNKQHQFSQAVLYPQTDGRDTYIVATNQAAGELLNSSKEVFLDNIQQVSGMNSKAVKAFFDFGPEIKLAVSPGDKQSEEKPTSLKESFAFRLRIPYRNPKIVDLRVNGHLLKKSLQDGYHSWYANGYTQIQITIDAKKAATTSLYVITCAYQPDVKRKNGWIPPAEALKRVKP